MGDHRASIKIEMEFHGVKDKTDMWINYYPDSEYGIDKRIVEFVESVYDRGMTKYNKRMEKYWAEQNKEKVEKEEKAELERLKNKYEKEPKIST